MHLDTVEKKETKSSCLNFMSKEMINNNNNVLIFHRGNMFVST